MVVLELRNGRWQFPWLIFFDTDTEEGGGNTAPTASADSDTTAFETVYNGDLSSLVTDPDPDTLTFSLSINGGKGTASINSNGTFTYTPDAEAYGVDTFTYQVDDGQGGTDTAIFTITIALPGNAYVDESGEPYVDENNIIYVSE